MPRHDEGFFSAKDNLRLFWTSDVPEAPVAHVGVVHGYADHCGRFRGVIDALVKDNVAVHAFDYRGHGRADGKRGYCDKFSDYVDDLERFWERLRGAAGASPTFLLAHSHGALMVLHWLQRAARPDLKGLVLTGPYLKLALTPPFFKVLAARAVGMVIPWLPIKSELTPADLSRDPEELAKTTQDPLYNTTVTPRWFSESNKAQLEALTFGPRITVPLLMMVGQNDGVASAPTARAFFETVASKDKTFREFDGMLHEVLNEIGKEQAWKEISSWISSHR